MSKKHSKQTEKQLIDIVNNHNNLNRCGECGSDYPTWASWNLGLLLCGKCANCHKKVLASGGPGGQPISKVKSLTLEVWTESQLDCLRSIGNRAARQKWNPKKVPFPYDDGVDDTPIEKYLKEKYIEGKFRYDPIGQDEYGDEYGRTTPSSGRSRGNLSATRNSRSRSSSKVLPRLSHRKLTSFELSQYATQAREIMSLGFLDRDAVVESLILSKGDINDSLDILNFDSKVNPALAECPPDLPRRPASSGATASTPSVGQLQPTATGSSGEWWTGQQVAQQTGLPTGAGFGNQSPQIYQYTDPVTGQVSYIDSNGQQYLDPSNPQHQTMMMQATNPQLLARQQTNQNILSLYNQPSATDATQQQQQQQPMQTMMPQQTMQQQQTQQMQPQMTFQMGAYQQNASMGAPVQNSYFTGQGTYASNPGYGQPTQQYGASQQYWR